MINEQLKATGQLTITLTDKDGNIKEQKTVPNLVVTTGKNLIASRMIDASQAVMSHMGIGTGTAAPAAADTVLQTPTGTRATLATASATGNVVTYAATFASGNGVGAITEAGIFNASTSGTMLCRTSFSPVNKDTLDVLTISWSITLT